MEHCHTGHTAHYTSSTADEVSTRPSMACSTHHHSNHKYLEPRLLHSSSICLCDQMVAKSAEQFCINLVRSRIMLTTLPSVGKGLADPQHPCRSTPAAAHLQTSSHSEPRLSK
eukprot:3078932-Pyramimonas_sp.AAC.1